MSDEPAPIVLELAPLPREQVGPFLLLGLEKDAEREPIEAHWAERVKAARKNQIRTPLEDVNWAREIINDTDRRFRAAATSLNLDTADGALKKLAQSYGLADTTEPSWKAYDSEKSLVDFTPPGPLPDLDEVRRTLRLPEAPADLPAVARLLKQFLPASLDPWSLNLSGDPPSAPADAGPPNVESREPQP